MPKDILNEVEQAILASLYSGETSDKIVENLESSGYIDSQITTAVASLYDKGAVDIKISDDVEPDRF